MQKIFKLIKKILIVTVFAIIAAIIFPILSALIIDDVALIHFRNEFISSLELPPDTEIVEVVSGCGNTSGTGNHIEMYVALLVKTGLSEDEWEELGTNAHNPRTDSPNWSWAMECLGLSFEHEGYHFAEGFYIFDKVKSAPCSIFDLRGH